MALRTIVISAVLLSSYIATALAAQDIAAATNKNVKVELDNAQVRVLRITLAPHQKMDLHQALGGVNIPLKNYTIVHTDTAGRAKEYPRIAGKPEWIPGGERIVQAGDMPVEAPLVEIKTPPPASK
jgi:hypothetical protein